MKRPRTKKKRKNHKIFGVQRGIGVNTDGLVLLLHFHGQNELQRVDETTHTRTGNTLLFFFLLLFLLGTFV